MQAPHATSPTDVELLDELGRGVHSVVYRARRQSRYYAVKVPLYGDLEHLEKVAQSFLREATALARVRHPALPAVMEVGWSNQVPYLVMELVAGETLASRLRSGPLSESEAVEAALQLTEALLSIHRAGLVHHDVSTSNILFDAHTDAVRLIDFGFAQSAPLSGRAPVRALPAQRGELTGPEVDLFALGCVLFECVTALSPFLGVDPQPMLERRGDHRDLKPRLSRPFAEVLRKLLRIDGEIPYDDAAHLLEDLRHLGDGKRARAADSPGLRLATTAPVALVGRDRELDRLRLAWRTSRARQGQVVLVRGASGTGKTRLIQAFIDEVIEASDSCFVYKCTQGFHEPFAWVRRLIHDYLLRFESLPAVEQGTAHRKFVELAGDAAPLLRVLSSRLGRILPDTGPAPRGDGAEEIFAEGLAEFLLKLLNESAPSTVIVDDVQWLDPGSRSVLSRLSDRDGARALIVLAARDDEEYWAQVGRLTRAFNPEHVWELSLEPLHENLVAQLIDAYLGNQPYDLELLRFVSTVGDQTPLSVLEVLRTLLEHGALVPNWGKWRFDTERAARLGVPRHGLELLARRVQSIRPTTAEILTAAAVLGNSFSHELLSEICNVSEQEASTALVEASSANLVETVGEEYRFVHDSVRDVLLDQVEESRLRWLHQQAGDALRRTLEGGGRFGSEPATPASSIPAVKMSLVYAVASHYAAGLHDEHPDRVLETCTAAGKLAFDTYDNELALRYFQEAEQAAVRLSTSLPLEIRLLVADAHLRTGDVETSIQQFGQIAELAADPVVRARTLSRIAFAQAHHDRESVWGTLERAFKTLGARPPSGGLLALFVGVLWWLRWLLWRSTKSNDLSERRVLEVLCGLYYQVGRLASLSGKVGHMVEVSLRGLVPAERLGPSGALCNAYLMYSFVAIGVGARQTSRRYLQRAEQLADDLRNPVVYAHMLQAQAAVLAWAGDISGCVRAGARSMAEYGRWRELSEFCITVYNQQQIEGLRGRCREAWRWIALAISRLNKHEGPPITVEFIEDSARPALMALGRERETDAVLSRLRETKRTKVPRAISAMESYGAHVRLFTECGRLDEGFEALVESVRAKRFDPKRVHLEMTEYYVHVAHARVHAVLRATGEERAEKLKHLNEALSDLTLAARIPLLMAHTHAVAAFCAFFHGHAAKAKRLLARAEQLGEQEAAPWVLYSVHRCRAHLARSQGELEAAQDQARLAEALAKEHRLAYRLRWIREEFQLRASTRGTGEESSLSSSAPSPLSLHADGTQHRSRAYLRSLVRIDQQTELGREQQAKTVIDELIETLSADRGFLFLAHSWPDANESDDSNSERRVSLRVVTFPSETGRDEQLDLVAARNVRGADVSDTDYDPALVEDVFTVSEPDGIGDSELSIATLASFQGKAVIVAPLIMRQQRIGVVYLDRPRRLWPFSDQDRDTLVALADQVPLVFELGRSLRARGRAEQTQRSQEKLEAIGRLAGGIAHDFNNMLSVIVSSTEQILGEGLAANVVEETTTIQSAATRARDLTRQLLSFSRGQYLNLQVVDLNQLVHRLEPIFRRLIGASELELQLSPDLCHVEVDPAQIDQVLTNLVVNAGDAMTKSGVLRIHTRTVKITDGRDDPRGLRSGTYARIEVSDTGEGMDATTLRHVFEPFFTTKAARSGTGLGLATAYGIITQSGGHIAVESRLGRGTTFTILLPAAKHRTPTLSPAADAKPKQKQTILLVDDEPLVRKATARLLRSLDYEVLVAESGETALSIVNQRQAGIDLVLTDVVMPEMNGLDLARELSRLSPSLKVLFMSGFTDGVLAERGVLKPGVMYLQKPIQREALASCLQNALGLERPN